MSDPHPSTRPPPDRAPAEAVCPGGCSGDRKTVRRVADSQTWGCEVCGRAWNTHEVRAANP
jgi:hypothetical protein